MFKNEKDPQLEAAKTRSTALDMLLDMMCESNTPTENKLPFLIMRAHHQVRSASAALVEKYATPNGRDLELVEVRKQALEYLQLVETGIRQFMETVKLPEESNQ